jgi:hypothetical protein
VLKRARTHNAWCVSIPQRGIRMLVRRGVALREGIAPLDAALAIPYGGRAIPQRGSMIPHEVE